ncbi:hypothetical protein DB88DRAFT_116050 [Papiliotrema laurentii]|uniref:LysM domain-containing protein n=1 Tax=Papiliotrema laurentii TaxID=5418 RepID=A0AAD9CUW0_PAPLA|nr:hypothetical protein DB88DRAFT_116050 [Papiliotrema laurentii]
MFATVLLAALPLLSSVMAVDGCTRSATVVQGDTCDAISHRYGVSTFQLALVNEDVITENCDNLQPNQTICLGIEQHDCTKVYTVVENDTCAWIQEVYGIDNATLWSNNPQIDSSCSNIYIGEVLCVDTNQFQYPEFNQTRYETVAYTYLPYCE